MYVRLLEERIEQALPDMRKQKKEWITAEIIQILELSDVPWNRTRVIKKLQALEEKHNNFTFRKTHWHNIGWELRFLK